MKYAIEVKNLHKSYGNIEAVKGIDFTVQKGEFFAFLGPNGAGKSTTIDILCTLLKPDMGTVKIEGFELGNMDHSIRQNIGVVFQENTLDDLLTIKENLYLRAAFYGLIGNKRDNAIEFAARSADVFDIIDRPYGKLSGGQKRRANIARALINTPKILFLDEPTTGLDPQTRLNIWETIYKLQRDTGMTVFLTTHYMEEAASADNIAIIDNGLIVATGTPAVLKEQYSVDKLYLLTDDDKRLLNILNQYPFDYKKQGEQFIIQLENSLDALPILETVKNSISGFQVIAGNLDDVFVNITGREIRENV
jgi:multidrug/hemolysin transport system ATP-binding protein